MVPERGERPFSTCARLEPVDLWLDHKLPQVIYLLSSFCNPDLQHLNPDQHRACWEETRLSQALCVPPARTRSFLRSFAGPCAGLVHESFQPVRLLCLESKHDHSSLSLCPLRQVMNAQSHLATLQSATTPGATHQCASPLSPQRGWLPVQAHV